MSVNTNYIIDGSINLKAKNVDTGKSQLLSLEEISGNKVLLTKIVNELSVDNTAMESLLGDIKTAVESMDLSIDNVETINQNVNLNTDELEAKLDDINSELDNIYGEHLSGGNFLEIIGLLGDIKDKITSNDNETNEVFNLAITDTNEHNSTSVQITKETKVGIFIESTLNQDVNVTVEVSYNNTKWFSSGSEVILQQDEDKYINFNEKVNYIRLKAVCGSSPSMGDLTANIII